MTSAPQPLSVAPFRSRTNPAAGILPRLHWHASCVLAPVLCAARTFTDASSSLCSRAAPAPCTPLRPTSPTVSAYLFPDRASPGSAGRSQCARGMVIGGSGDVMVSWAHLTMTSRMHVALHACEAALGTVRCTIWCSHTARARSSVFGRVLGSSSDPARDSFMFVTHALLFSEPPYPEVRTGVSSVDNPLVPVNTFRNPHVVLGYLLCTCKL